MKTSLRLRAFMAAVLFSACRVTPPSPPQGQPLNTATFSGTGSWEFVPAEPLDDRPIEVFYHIPEDANTLTPILITFHGNRRDGDYSRDALINMANQRNFIVLAPTYTKELYPTNRYHLGNVFDDGEESATSALNPPSEWTYSTVEPIFYEFTNAVQSEAKWFDLFGHSAGGQFVHRMVQFMPAMNYRKAVAAASGWYTVPDSTIPFPYGTQYTPIQFYQQLDYFSRDVLILVGEDDTDENSAGLRHTPEADAQGLNRFDRAHFFYGESALRAQQIQADFNWDLQVSPGVNHSYSGNAAYAIDLMYP